MKKLAVILMASAMLFTAGCGDNEKVMDGSVQNLDAGESQAEESKQDTPETQEPSQDEESTESAESGHEAKGYVFYSGETGVEMDADMEPILKELGEPASYYESPSCAFNGIDKTYTYSGFEIDTYPSGKKDYVFTVVLRDDTVTTAEGVAVGDSVEKLKEAYPEAEESQTESMIVCEKDGMKLCFIIQEDKVAAIEYRSSAWYNVEF